MPPSPHGGRGRPQGIRLIDATANERLPGSDFINGVNEFGNQEPESAR
jgi:hypothetical protein